MTIDRRKKQQPDFVKYFGLNKKEKFKTMFLFLFWLDFRITEPI